MNILVLQQYLLQYFLSKKKLSLCVSRKIRLIEEFLHKSIVTQNRFGSHSYKSRHCRHSSICCHQPDDIVVAAVGHRTRTRNRAGLSYSKMYLNRRHHSQSSDSVEDKSDGDKSVKIGYNSV